MFRTASTLRGSLVGRFVRTAILGGAVALPALTGAAFAGESAGYHITLSAPGPAQILEQASVALRDGTRDGASALIAQAEHRLLIDGQADNLPQAASVASMRDAVGVLDHARQALSGGDVATAAADVATARGML